MSEFKPESFKVKSIDGVELHTWLFKPDKGLKVKNDNLAIVLVHPYSSKGGLQELIKGIAYGLALNGYTAVTFNRRGVKPSTGEKCLSGGNEVKDVVSVSKWVSQSLSLRNILLLGYSAGAPLAGSVVDQIEEVIGYVSIAYPFGIMASMIFGTLNKDILHSPKPKPKLFIMGTGDEFTSVHQLKDKLTSAVGRTETHLIDGAKHFKRDKDFKKDVCGYDAPQMVGLVIKFIESL